MKVMTYLFTLACCAITFTGCNSIEPDIHERKGAAYKDGGPEIVPQIERGALEQADLYDLPPTYGPGMYDFPQLFPEPYIAPNPEVPPEEGLDIRF